ncbi:helix-turn-helix transcriptional regulator [Glycomyces harbinensis]|uniref:Helix-turn-helix domain-containing protein n=1 Tax=Glycomyces harbinensis TaxID=58114 RepID=A0A1G6ZI66_9ACTN|nr:helix-turn-helix transcriptional regulator [Glycomyces harbinensis]SDE02338.1 Helix-turn-helix domain-containing protein [Glycomyces harbinensis]
MEEVRRAALGEFLRSRRRALSPGEVGLAPGLRRRTPGLRREEVAVLSNVGVTWYTWLEQGRDINPSPEILAAIAGALRLDAAGTEYLFRLVGQLPPSSEPIGAGVPERLLRMMHAQHPAPAIIIDGGWDLVGWNDVADALYGYTRVPPGDRNPAWLFFASERIRSETVGWEAHARRMVGELRESFARDPNRRMEALLGRLREHFPQAAAWLDEHEVVHRGAGIDMDVDHPRIGMLRLEQVVLHSAEAPDLQLVVKLPKPYTGTEERLRLLCDVEDAPLDTPEVQALQIETPAPIGNG